MPATTDEADIERHRRHNKNADYWLARFHRSDHLRRERERQRQVSAPGSVTACTASYLLQGVRACPI